METESFELLAPCLQSKRPTNRTVSHNREIWVFPLSRRSLCIFYIHSPSHTNVWAVGLSGLEPPTSRLSGVRSNQLSYKPILKSSDFSGDEEIRTLDPLLARQVLSQLSYIPI